MYFIGIQWSTIRNICEGFWNKIESKPHSSGFVGFPPPPPPPLPLARIGKRLIATPGEEEYVRYMQGWVDTPTAYVSWPGRVGVEAIFEAGCTPIATLKVRVVS